MGDNEDLEVGVLVSRGNAVLVGGYILLYPSPEGVVLECDSIGIRVAGYLSGSAWNIFICAFLRL